MRTRTLLLASCAAFGLTACAANDVPTTGPTASLARPGVTASKASTKHVKQTQRIRGSKRVVDAGLRDEAGPIAAAIDKCTKRMDAVLKGNSDAAGSAADKLRADLECRAVRSMMVR